MLSMTRYYVIKQFLRIMQITKSRGSIFQVEKCSPCFDFQSFFFGRLGFGATAAIMA